MKPLWLAPAFILAIAGISQAMVNINTATKTELMSLKGIGEKSAQQIIDYRNKNGRFKSIEDLEVVPGIGPSLMKQIRGNITTTGETVIDSPAARDSKSKITHPKVAKTSQAKKSESGMGATSSHDNRATWTSTNEKPKAHTAPKPAKTTETKKSKVEKMWTSNTESK